MSIKFRADIYSFCGDKLGCDICLKEDSSSIKLIFSESELDISSIPFCEDCIIERINNFRSKNFMDGQWSLKLK